MKIYFAGFEIEAKHYEILHTSRLEDINYSKEITILFGSVLFQHDLFKKYVYGKWKQKMESQNFTLLLPDHIIMYYRFKNDNMENYSNDLKCWRDLPKIMYS